MDRCEQWWMSRLIVGADDRRLSFIALFERLQDETGRD
jgi:hypothetical protein